MAASSNGRVGGSASSADVDVEEATALLQAAKKFGPGDDSTATSDPHHDVDTKNQSSYYSGYGSTTTYEEGTVTTERDETLTGHADEDDEEAVFFAAKKGSDRGGGDEPRADSDDDNDDEDCYASIPKFHDFADLCRDCHYRELPTDWCVLVADVQGSTACIEVDGRYRDVNTVGAMTIAAVRNALQEQAAGRAKKDSKDDSSSPPLQEFPYVFGGDGASLVVRPHQVEPAVAALLALQRMVAQNYKMHLRVGKVTVGELQERGATVQVARYEIVSGMCIALFRGGGLAMADAITKEGGGELAQSPASVKTTPNLDGLSCRWQKIPNRNGCVLTILVMSNPEAPDEAATYQSVLHQLDKILQPETMKTANPVNPELATYKTAAEMIEDEIRMHETAWSVAWISRFVEILLCHMLFFWRILQYAIIDAPAYVAGMRTHSDFRKFDDMIRMVLDCSEEQADSIELYLKSLYDDGRQVFYGTRRSHNTLMTCLLQDTNEGNHVHFVDGDAGGYAMASKQLKMQLGAWAMRRRGSGVRRRSSDNIQKQ